MPAGLHIVRKMRPGKSAIWYCYAWRGGPLIERIEGGRPKVTARLTDAAADARRNYRAREKGDTIAGLIDQFQQSAEWARLAASTKANWRTWLDRIVERFGNAPLAVFEDRKVRGDILAWRDGWADKPRSADAAMQVMSRLLSFGFDRGRLKLNIATGIGQLYEADRSEIIWEAVDFDRFRPAATIEVWEGVQLASLIGLRRGDLVNLPWSAIGDHAIIWRTAKSRGKNMARIPLLPEARALLASIKARQEAAMAARRPHRRTELPPTVLLNSYLKSWAPMGFGSRFNDAKVASGIDKHLHDLRGTFATRCMLAGLTDEQIAEILGWSTKDVASIRNRYVDQTRVVIAIGEKLARGASS